MADPIFIEVVYARPDKQVLRKMTVASGTTAREAIEDARLAEEFPDLVVDETALGVFSRKVAPDYVLKPGDRLEIYRPLVADPKESRRRRAKGKT